MTVRVDRYGPEWTHSLIQLLEDGYSPREAKAATVEGLEAEAQRVEDRAKRARARAEQWERACTTVICGEDMARTERRQSDEAFGYALRLRESAATCKQLKGEYISIGNLLR